jgi:hypothetical protein
MTGTYVIIGLALVLAIVAILLGRSSRSAGTDSRDLSGIFLDGIPAKHPRLFPIIQQALSNQDAEFLNSHVEPRSRKRALAARRAAALFFLAGLRADFRKLTELSRLLAKAAPESAHATEMERIKLEWKFNLLYVVVWLKLRTGALPVVQLHALSDTIGAMASRLEVAMHAWQDASLLSKV